MLPSQQKAGPESLSQHALTPLGDLLLALPYSDVRIYPVFVFCWSNSGSRTRQDAVHLAAGGTLLLVSLLFMPSLLLRLLS